MKNPWPYMAQTMADAIRAIDPDTPIIVAWHQLPTGFQIKGDNIIYSRHFYSPHSYTHQGVGNRNIEWTYPGMINGAYWNKDQMRNSLQRYIEYAEKHDLKLFIGDGMGGVERDLQCSTAPCLNALSSRQ